MIAGKTNSGFEFEIDEDSLDDYELLEMAGEVDKGDVSLIPDVAKRILGDTQVKKLKDHIRDENGKVSAIKMTKEIEQILSSGSQGKN